MTYIDTINNKKAVAKTEAKAQQTLDSLVNQLKEVQLATLMNGSKSSVILADSTDFGEKMAQLGDKITAVIDELKNDTRNTDKLADLANQYEKLATYNVKVARDSADELKKVFSDTLKVLKNLQAPEIEVATPQVNVPAPIVNVPKNDFSPITKAIESLKEEKGIDLDDFMAHDISEEEGKQYVGFVAPTGAWYIVENLVDESKLRYVFGRNGYEKAFKKASTYQYEILSEAINAI